MFPVSWSRIVCFSQSKIAALKSQERFANNYSTREMEEIFFFSESMQSVNPSFPDLAS